MRLSVSKREGERDRHNTDGWPTGRGEPGAQRLVQHCRDRSPGVATRPGNGRVVPLTALPWSTPGPQLPSQGPLEGHAVAAAGAPSGLASWALASPRGLFFGLFHSIM